MSTKTTMLKLTKPELSDPANITAMNENWDKIDEAHRCYGSLEDVGITSFPTTFIEIANTMPDNSMVLLGYDNILDDGSHQSPKDLISDWGLSDRQGVGWIIKGDSHRLSMFWSFSNRSDEDSPITHKLYLGEYTGWDGLCWTELAPKYTYGTTDLTAGTSALETGKLHFVYE